MVARNQASPPRVPLWLKARWTMRCSWTVLLPTDHDLIDINLHKVVRATPGSITLIFLFLKILIASPSLSPYMKTKLRSSFHVRHRVSKYKCLIPLSKLLKSSDFLHDDCCIFGVEIVEIDVFSPQKKAIVKATTVQNLFIQKSGFIKKTYNMSMNFELKSKDHIRSRTFEFGGHNWYLSIYPQGDQYSTNCLSLYMYLDAADGDPPLELGPAVDLVLSIVDQKYGVDHFRKTIGVVVYAGKHRWGFSNFCPLSTLTDRSRGYIVESRYVIQVEMTIVGSSN